MNQKNPSNRVLLANLENFVSVYTESYLRYKFTCVQFERFDLCFSENIVKKRKYEKMK